jgi:hypothetical protein
MTARILIAGGYGSVGSAIARQVRALSPDVELVLAGRHPDKGTALARELGRASTAYLDIENVAGAPNLEAIDLIVSALYDPANVLVHAALTQGIGHVGITTKAEDVAPIACAVLQSPPQRPIVLLGHSMAGVATIVARKAAEHFRRVDTIAVAALYDVRDPVGPMTAGDADMLVSRALLREGGTWKWVEGLKHAGRVSLPDGSVLQGYPAGLLDAPSLASITGAANVRLDMIQGDSIGTREGGPASSDVYIDLEGILQSGKSSRHRVVASDPSGLLHLTALGVLVAIERVLGLDGRPAPTGGLYLPETLVLPDAAIARFEQFGVRLAWADGTPETLRAAV